MKKTEDIRCIGVIGAGTMGSGIAQLASQSGFKIIFYDVLENATHKAFGAIDKQLTISVEKKKLSSEQKDKILSRFTVTNDFNKVIADVVIEAIVEDLEIKSETFSRLAKINDDDSLFCTNTSSIPITKIARGIPHPERIVGMHFFNPVHAMKLVEVVSGENTSPQNAQAVYELAKKFGKEPVMTKDSPGFIVNRIGKMYHTEPLKILEEKIAPVETIDALLESSGFKMGPFKLIDLIGVDANLNVTKSLYELFNGHPKFKPSGIQQQLVNSGFLGKKSGKGFYVY